jgi:hypothetical protein
MSKKLTPEEGRKLSEIDATLAAVEAAMGSIPIGRLRFLIAVAQNEVAGHEVQQNWYADKLGKWLPDGSPDGGYVADQVRFLLGLRTKDSGPVMIVQDRFEGDRRSVLLRLSAFGRGVLQDIVRRIA